MSRRPRSLIASAILFLAGASACFAQNSSANVPANQPAPPPAASDSSAPNPPQEPKKVWTNEDISDLRANSTISTVGDTKNKTRRFSTRPGPSEDLVRSYRAQIDGLQARVAGIDKQITDLRAALSGKTVDATRKYNGAGGKIGDWNAQIEQLQKNRQDVLQQIDALELRIRQSNP